MKRVLLSALLAATALQASAGIVNGSFESGLTGWTTFGSTGVFDNPPTSGATTDGFKSASVTALLGGANNAAGLEAFVGVSDTALRAIKSPAGYTPAFINGGAIQQSFDVAGGETLKFDWRFATNEATLANDFSFFVLDGAAVALGDTGSTVFTVYKPDVPGDYTKGTDWITRTVPLGAGSHTLSFAALQGANTSRESSLLVDKVRLQSDQRRRYPNPSALAWWAWACLSLVATAAARPDGGFPPVGQREEAFTEDVVAHRAFRSSSRNASCKGGGKRS